MQSGILTGIVSAALVATAAIAAPPPERVALTGGTVLTVAGEPIENGTVLIERGKIIAVGGADIEIPYDAFELDCTGHVVMPGMIHPHFSAGLDVANETLPVVPFVDVFDAIDPSSLFFENALRDGITALHAMQGNNTVIAGVSRVVNPIGLSVHDMTVQADVGLKLSVSPRRGSDRMVQMAELREAFAELDDTLDDLAEAKYEEKLEKDDKPMDVGPAEARERGRELIGDDDYDDASRNLVRLRNGNLAGWVYAGAATDVANAIKLAEEQSFKDDAVLVVAGDAHLAAREVAAAELPVVLPPTLYYRERDPISGELIEAFIPSAFHDAGVPFALVPNPNDSYAERFLNYQAALLVRNGIPRDVALQSITLRPAEMLGLGDRLGSIEVGKDADLVVFSGDPLDFQSTVEYVYIDGVMAYERATDSRLQNLIEVDEPVAENDAGTTDDTEADTNNEDDQE